MPKKLGAEEIADAVYELEQATRNATLKEVADELDGFAKQGPGPYGSPDTWEAGFADAIATIRENWSVS